MKKIKFTKKEVEHLLIAGLVLGFIFSFKEWGEESFNLLIGLSNLTVSVIAALLVFVIHELGHKIVARRSEATTEFRTWSIERFWFHKWSSFKKKIPIGIIGSLILAFFSNGNIKFAALETTKIEENPIYRTRKKFPHLTHFEKAVIALAGPIASIALALIAKVISTSNPLFIKIATMSIYLAAYSMIPISKLDGLKILVGSIPLYILSAIFIAMVIILLPILNTALVIILALITAIALTLLYLYTTN